MDKKFARNLAVYEYIDFDYVSSRPNDPMPDFEDSQLKQVLDAIFLVDEVTGLPKGDIQYYMSENGNPQVKQWIENYLLKPRSLSNGLSMEELTDDMRVEFSRKPDESIADYQARLKGFYDDASVEYQKYLASLKSDTSIEEFKKD